MEITKLLGYNITYVLDDFNLKKKIIHTLNAHSYCVAKKDKLFRRSLQNADILIPDGIGIVFAAKILNNIHI